MKFIFLCMTALCFAFAIICAMRGYDFLAGLNVFAAVLNAGSYFDCLTSDH